MNRANEVGGYALLHGVEKASEQFNMESRSVRRYIRKAKANKAPLEKKKPIPKKVLLLDIETTPMEVYVWGLYKQRINHLNIIKEWNVICWSAKWLNDSQYLGDCLTSKESIQRNDKRILQSIWKLLEKADVVIGHNVERFDLRKLNARFKYYGINPPTPYQTIDTLKHSRRNFAFSSHKQDYITKFLKLPEKIETNFNLWIRCLHGEKEALNEMFNYCEHDVGGLEELYLSLRAWMKSHPNLAIYGDLQEERCPACLSTNLKWIGDYATPMGLFDSFRCKNCGHIGRARTGVLTKFEKENLTRSIAR